MAPALHPHSHPKQGIHPSSNDGERIVISGMAGLYPQSRHVKDLANILYNKENPINRENLRYNYKHPEVIEFTGNVPNVDRFDAQFFRVHYHLGNNMDAMSRKILEQTFQAIYDAGVNPEQLSGKKIGVYVGTCFSETEKASFYDASSRTGFGIAGCSKAMFANRISYWLNAKGPSMSIDEACCSSAAALEQAYLAMSRGECEAAVVGAAFLCLHPQSSVHYGRTLKLSTDGKTKAFTQDADGCAKSEAIGVIFLQKAKDAVRIYADVINTKCEYIGMMKSETGPKYGFYREPGATVNFIKKFYEESKTIPQAIEYVEAFGSASPDIDKAELQAIDEVFCKNRDDTLLVGSVMSNIGYNEAASGISAITKVLLGYHFGELAANLHCEQPRQDVAALREGRVRLLTERRRFGRGFVAVNGMSVTGVNSHTLLHGHYKPKDLSRYKSNIPRLVTISARQESAVQKILENLKSRSVDPEELALFYNIHQYNITGHLGRGYIVLDNDAEQKTVSVCENAAYFDDARRPLWFVYSGMGSQWPGMGAQLMRIPIFAAAIERCNKVLQPKGINIVDIITSSDEKVFDNILHSFVGIAAIQIGLTDILHALGLKPDGIIGHSVGELGCAYADGCLTAEEMILSAYSRGLVSLQTPFIRGSMAAVGMGYAQIVKMCPPEIEVACHNGPESSTISGPAKAMSTFVAELTAKAVFAKEVPCSNIAYHSRYIADAGPGLLKYLKEVIKTPKARSNKWISSSVPEDNWDSETAKFSSAEYHTNNLLNPVLFEETSRRIPSNAVLVEVAPHGLLQAILKRSLSPECVNIPLTRRKHADNVCFLLEAIGKLYITGYLPKVQNLYPKIQFPVSTGTPLLSHLVEWAHNEIWPISLYCTALRRSSACCKYAVTLFDTEHEYLRGNIILGQTLYPFAATLVAVWDTLAMVLGLPKKQVSVQFLDVYLYTQPILHDRRQLSLNIVLHRGSGSFEIMEDNYSKVATGYIHQISNTTYSIANSDFMANGDHTLMTDDIYQWFEDRGCSYRDQFRSIVWASPTLSEAGLIWNNNWVTLIDGMLQMYALRQPHNTVSTPTFIRRLDIDVDQHKIVESLDQKVAKAEFFEKYDLARCGGVFMENIIMQNMTSNNEHKVLIDKLKFVPNSDTEIKALSSLQVYVQILSRNLCKDTLNVLGITDYVADNSVFQYIQGVSQIPGIKINYEQICPKDCEKSFTGVDAIIVQNLSANENLRETLYQKLPQNKFIVSEEKLSENCIKPLQLYRILASHYISGATGVRFDLICWRPLRTDCITEILTLRSVDSSDLGLASSACESLAPGHKLIIFAPYPSVLELQKLMSHWREENKSNSISLVMADNLQNAAEQYNDVGFAYNVIKNGQQGGEYHISDSEPYNMECANATLVCERIGYYNSLGWVEASESVLPMEIVVQVEYAGITNTDYKKASGIIPLNDDSDNSYGMDFSGITKSGERVMGMLPKGACSKQIRAIPELLWPVPEHWSLEDAATVPSAYLHAMYLLIFKGRIVPGRNVLIHGGAGALGQAAIAVALAHDCTVFTTVSDVRKKRFLLRLFPDLKDEHIGNSRDSSFKDTVLTATRGYGCTLIISSLKGEHKKNNFACCAFSGTIVDASQLHDHELFNYEMSAMTIERSYVLSDFYSVLSKSDSKDIKQLQLMLSEGIARGFVRPLTRVTFAAHDAARAFRLLAASAHRGRVLLAMRDEAVPAQPRIARTADSFHVLVCGEDSIGLHLAERLIARGARRLYLHFKTGSSEILRPQIQAWQKQGLEVVLTSNDLDTDETLRVLLINLMGLDQIEGIYMVNIRQEKVISSLDALARKYCPTIKYFAVIGSSGSYGKTICLSRQQNSLPATMLSLPQSEDSKWAYRHEWINFALEAIDRALRSSEAVLLASPLRAPNQSLLQQLTRVAGITLRDNVTKETKLKELGVEGEKLTLISNFLRSNHNICYNETQLAQLTIEKINKLENVTRLSEFERLDGFAKFINYVDSDELLATTEMVLLPTLVTAALIRDDEFDPSQSYMCIVPGLEGHHYRFRGLCERLKLPALVLQPGLDNPHETPRELAERFSEVLLKKAGVKENFYLLGYESGSAVAFEIAGILEDHGLTGTIFCLGCTPRVFQDTLEDQMKEFGMEDQLQDAVLYHMFKLMAGDDTSALDEALKNMDTWPQKVEACVRTLLGRVPHSAQYARELIEATLARIDQVLKYPIAERALRSKIVLLQAATHAQTDMEALQRHSQQPVAVHQLAAPLEHAAADLRCAAIINRCLQPELLEQYDNRNTCESYLINPGSFMSLGATEE